VTLVSGTNAEADAINDAIQHRQVTWASWTPVSRRGGWGSSASSSGIRCRPGGTTG
jgi:hypothetical protein